MAEQPKQQSRPRRARQRTLNLTPDPGPRLSESCLQGHVIAVLSGLGYRVQYAGWGRRRVPCPSCGVPSAPTGYVGNSVGLSDIFVRRQAWTPGAWLHIELKAKGRTKAQCTSVTAEQQALADEGANLICRSVAEAVDAVAGAEAAMGLMHEKIARFWENNPRSLFE